MTNPSHADIETSGPAMPGRRRLLAARLGVAAASLLPISGGRAQTAPTGTSGTPLRPSSTQRRELGSPEVSALGMGCQNFAGMYGPPTNRQEAVRIIRAAYDRGVTFFDVAEVYGPFLGEEITGEALAPMRDRVVIATKFGFDITPEGKVQGVTSRPDRIKRVTEESLLKFIGDAVLAIFPTSCEHDRMAACRKALAAAQEFCQRAEAENVLRRSSGTPPLAHSLALHVGEVAYGSVGAPHRLDFTVIGPAVNRASRLLDLAKRLDQQVLVSHAVARELDQPLVDLGRHQLRDVEKPQRVFTLLKQGSVRSHRSTRQATS